MKTISTCSAHRLRFLPITLLFLLFSISLFAQELQIDQPAPPIPIADWLNKRAIKVEKGRPQIVKFYFGGDKHRNVQGRTFLSLANAFQTNIDFTVLCDSQATALWTTKIKELDELLGTDTMVYYKNTRIGIGDDLAMEAYRSVPKDKAVLIDGQGILKWYGSLEDLTIKSLVDFLESGKIKAPIREKKALSKEALDKMMVNSNPDFSTALIHLEKVDTKGPPRIVSYDDGWEYHNLTFKELLRDEELIQRIFYATTPEAHEADSRYYLSIRNAASWMVANAKNRFYFNFGMQNILYEHFKRVIPFQLGLYKKPFDQYTLSAQSFEKLDQYRGAPYMPLGNTAITPKVVNDTLIITGDNMAIIGVKLGTLFPPNRIDAYGDLNDYQKGYNLKIPVEDLSQSLQFLDQVLGIQHEVKPDTLPLLMWCSTVPDSCEIIDVANKSYEDIARGLWYPDTKAKTPDSAKKKKKQGQKDPSHLGNFSKRLEWNQKKIRFFVNDWVDVATSKKRQGEQSPSDADKALLVTFYDPAKKVETRNMFQYLVDLSVRYGNDLNIIVVNTGEPYSEAFRVMAWNAMKGIGTYWKAGQGLESIGRNKSAVNTRPQFEHIYWANSLPQITLSAFAQRKSGQSYLFTKAGYGEWTGNVKDLSFWNMDRWLDGKGWDLASEAAVEDTFRYFDASQYFTGTLGDASRVIKEEVKVTEKAKRAYPGGVEYMGYSPWEIIRDLLPLQMKNHPFGGVIINDDVPKDPIYLEVKGMDKAKDKAVAYLLEYFDLDLVVDEVQQKAWVMRVVDEQRLKAFRGRAENTGRFLRQNGANYLCQNCLPSELALRLWELADAYVKVEMPNIPYRFKLPDGPFEVVKDYLETEIGIQLEEEEEVFWKVIRVGKDLAPQLPKWQRGYALMEEEKTCLCEIGAAKEKVATDLINRRGFIKDKTNLRHELVFLAHLKGDKGYNYIEWEEHVPDTSFSIHLLCSGMDREAVRLYAAEALLDHFGLQAEKQMMNKEVYRLEIVDDYLFQKALSKGDDFINQILGRYFAKGEVFLQTFIYKIIAFGEGFLE
ncbi:MAG: hypothetical protein AAFP19_20420 [Bacteroidota bacterium]